MNYTEGQKVIDFLVVKEITRKTDKAGREYIDMKLSDATGQINTKVWGPIDTPEKRDVLTVKAGDVIKVDAVVDSYNGNLQLKVNRLRFAAEGEYEESSLYRTAPMGIEEMLSAMEQFIDSMKDEDYKKLCREYAFEKFKSYRHWPAAKSVHHDFKGGLLYHTLRMLRMGYMACNIYPELNRDRLCTGIIFHDIAKIEEIQADKNGVPSEYSMRGEFFGHLVMGVMEIERVCTEMHIPEEKKLVLQQMVLGHHENPEWGSPVRPLIIEGEVLHYIDNLDAKVMMFSDVLKDIPEGEFSDKCFFLDNRRVFKAG